MTWYRVWRLKRLMKRAAIVLGVVDLALVRAGWSRQQRREFGRSIGSEFGRKS